jgi:hypothetical protein
MSPTASPLQLGEAPMCAVCNEPVVAILGAPARHELSPNTTVYAPRHSCTLRPCGHTFTARKGGLIH